MMQADGAGGRPQAAGGVPNPYSNGDLKRPGLWERIKFWDSQFSVAKGLTVVTLLTGFFGGYFQYLNAYEEKVSADAKEDMANATATFVEISNTFAEAQMLQQIIYFDLKSALGADPGDTAMSTKNARDTFPDYVKVRTALRQNSGVLARKAELYVDWASDLKRDPAAQKTLDTDPLSETLLGDYNFECDAPLNFPHFMIADTQGEDHDPNQADEDSCAAGKEVEDSKRLYLRHLCAKEDGKVVPDKPSVTINWYSAKHHVLTMHYCFEAAHRRIETARVWASNIDLSEQRKNEFLAGEKQAQADLNNQVIRLNAFMGLAMSQLERIRVKYRPVGFFCHVPLVRDAIGLFSTRCTPVRMASGDSS
jgi:hypothetical protein